MHLILVVLLATMVEEEVVVLRTIQVTVVSAALAVELVQVEGVVDRILAVQQDRVVTVVQVMHIFMSFLLNPLTLECPEVKQVEGVEDTMAQEVQELMVLSPLNLIKGMEQEVTERLVQLHRVLLVEQVVQVETAAEQQDFV